MSEYKELLKKALSEGRVVIGSRQVLKKLKMSDPELVVIANNCPENIRKDIEYYCKLGNVRLEVFDGSGRELGVFCGKPFPIAALAVVKKK